MTQAPLKAKPASPSAPSVQPTAPAAPRAVSPEEFRSRQEIAQNRALIQSQLKNPGAIANALFRCIEACTERVAASDSVTHNVKAAGSAVHRAQSGARSAARKVGWVSPVLGAALDSTASAMPGAADAVARQILTPTHTADFTQGSTRHLSQLQDGQVVRDQITREVVLQRFLEAIPKGLMPKVVQAYDRIYSPAGDRSGKSLSATLGERIRDLEVKARVMALLPPPLDDRTLAFDAFLEQLAVGMVYSDQSADELNGEAQEDRRESSPKTLLDRFGFTAREAVQGRWGFQMRIFQPVAGKVHPGWDQPILAFRGTEGIKLDIDGAKGLKHEQDKQASDRARGGIEPALKLAEKQTKAQHEGVEGSLDTIVGDFSEAEVGSLQYMPNAELIEAQVRRESGGKKMNVTGHSLGGALAQIYTALNPEHVGQLVTFQAANIDRKTVQQFRTNRSSASVRAREYRVDGDAVPTAGQAALPGQMYYFDRATRPQGSRGAYSNDVAQNASAGHVTPMLSTYIRGQTPRSGDLKTLSDFGMKDEATLKKYEDDGRPVPRQDVKMIFSGEYGPGNDPRIVLEEQRQTAAKLIQYMPGEDLFEQVFYQHIAYNTALSHLERLAKSSRSFEQFSLKAAELMKSATLTLDAKELALAGQLGIDETDTQLSRNLPLTHVPVSLVPTPRLMWSRFHDYKNAGVPLDAPTRQAIQSNLRRIYNNWQSTP